MNLTQAFEVTFNMLPDDAKKALETYWHGKTMLMHDGKTSEAPVLILCPNLSGRKLKNGKTAAMGQTDGIFFMFDNKVDQYPIEAASAIIAHELGHAYWKAIDKKFKTRMDEETATRQLNESWGFEP